MNINDKIDVFFARTKTDRTDWYLSRISSKDDRIDTKPKHPIVSFVDTKKCGLCGLASEKIFYINHDKLELSSPVGADCLLRFLSPTRKESFQKKLNKIAK